MNHSSEERRAWFRGVEPVCAELFNAAHVMCGNYDLAEYALRSAILDVWAENASGGMGFRERLRGALRREAFAIAQSDEAMDTEFTWTWPAAGAEDDAILSQLARERPETQRLAMLRYGCGLSPRAIAELTDLSRRQVSSELERLEARCRRNLPRQTHERTEMLMARRVRRLLARGETGTPRIGQVYRAFEAETGGTRASGHRFSRVAGTAVSVLFAVLCAALFWLFAVLVQPV